MLHIKLYAENYMKYTIHQIFHIPIAFCFSWAKYYIERYQTSSCYLLLPIRYVRRLAVKKMRKMYQIANRKVYTAHDVRFDAI